MTIFSNGNLTGTHKELCKALNTSLALGKMESWPEGPWQVSGAAEPLPPSPEHVPMEVSMRQARIMLLRLGILSEVDAIIDQLGVGAEEARIEWEYSTTVSRDWPLIGAIASRLNMAPEEIDQMFIAARSV